MDVVHCTSTGKPKLAFTVQGQDVPVDLDVTSDGSAVLLTDDHGKVWRWDGSGNPVQLNNSIPLSHVTW
jgi:glucose/arabinose dehydrogenase